MSLQLGPIHAPGPASPTAGVYSETPNPAPSLALHRADYRISITERSPSMMSVIHKSADSTAVFFSAEGDIYSRYSYRVVASIFRVPYKNGFFWLFLLMCFHNRLFHIFVLTQLSHHLLSNTLSKENYVLTSIPPGYYPFKNTGIHYLGISIKQAKCTQPPSSS